MYCCKCGCSPWTLEREINKYVQIISVVRLQGGTAEDIICRTIYRRLWLALFLWTWITQMLRPNLQLIKSGKHKEQDVEKSWQKLPKIAVIGDIFSRVCRRAISSKVWLGTMAESVFGGKTVLLFLFQAGPVPLSYVSIAKDGAKPHRVKKQFPTSWQLYKCMVANVGGEKGEVGVDKGVKDTMVAVVELRG